jgi:hypothetical protein
MSPSRGLVAPLLLVVLCAGTGLASQGEQMRRPSLGRCGFPHCFKQQKKIIRAGTRQSGCCHVCCGLSMLALVLLLLLLHMLLLLPPPNTSCRPCVCCL